MPAGDGDRPGPRRTCVGCRRRAHPDELVRVVRTDEGGLAVGRHLPGRGAWVCPQPGCVEAARKRRAWGRALRAPVSEAAVVALGEELAPDRGTLDGRTDAPQASGRGTAPGT